MPSRLEVLQRMVAQEPKDPFPYYALALELRSAGNMSEALQAFGALKSRFPDYVPQYLMAGQVCAQQGLTQEARAWFEAGIAVASAKRDAHALGELQSALAGLP